MVPVPSLAQALFPFIKPIPYQTTFRRVWCVGEEVRL